MTFDLDIWLAGTTSLCVVQIPPPRS